MSNYYSDPTASAAIGSIDKELNRMRKKAALLREQRESGVPNERGEAALRGRYPTGLVRRQMEGILAGTIVVPTEEKKRSR